MALTTKQKHELKKFINGLSQYKGRHTELVTVYIPSGYDINKIINHLNQEQGTATNIKSTSTRKNVIDALERMIQHLKLFKQTPEHGLAAFSGNVAEREGQSDVKVWSIEPPIPLKIRIYRCDKKFVLEPLDDMLENKEVYGLVVMDRRDANIAFLKGKTIVPLVKTHSQVPGKFRAGGQCHIFGTLVQSASGSILKIENCHNPIDIKSMIIDNYSIKDSPITDKWTTKKHKVYKIKTKFPQLITKCSKDHLFFVSTDEGIVEKPAEDLEKGDCLIMPEKIEIKGKKQKIDSKKYYNHFTITKEGQKYLKQKRLKKGLSQNKLAKRMNVFQADISSYEIKKVNFSPMRIIKICKELDINFSNFLEKFTQPYLYRNIKLPREINEEFAQFLGYYIGDGSIETDRITFFEQDKQVALDYKKKFDVFFGMNSSYRFRESKNYHQIRFTSRPLVRLIRNEFPEIKKTLDSEIPKKILESASNIVASFLRGFFDAEGYIKTKESIGIASNNKTIIGQIQLLLLRFGILSSFMEYDNKKNPYSDNPIFKLQINEKESIQNYKKNIGFTSKKKKDRLELLIKSKSDKSSVRQIIVPGKKIRELIEKAGYNLELFPKVNSFFRNERMMSKQTFKNSILKNILDKKLYKKLEDIYNYPILPVKIHKIEIKEETTEMIDISVKNQNFIANGLIVHNSAQRFARLREGAAKDHYKKVAEYVKEQFLGNKNLKGIIIGGPGPTKYDFAEGNYITTELKNKIIAIKDLSYTGDFGLQELVDKSQDVLAKEEIAEEKAIMLRFFELLSTKPGMVSYGEAEVMKNLQMGVVETVLLSESLEEEKISKFEEEAQKVNSEVKIISTETREGAQLKEIGKAAAILRYEIS
jgi:peptide subunit release factor 1 (eRF1)/intein/homing endonuclease